jgi:hypothetical protein
VTLVVAFEVLEPAPDEAKSSMRRELLRPEYYSDNWFQRLLGWLERQLDRGIDAASGLSAVSALAAMLVAVGLIGGLAWLASRARPAARAPRARASRVREAKVTASQLRDRAETALANGDVESAVADAFRAIALRQVERGSLEETPGTTAQEAARFLSEAFPAYRDRVSASAALFDAITYGDQSATPDQAVGVLELDAELGAAR